MNVLFRRNLGFIFDAVQIISCKTARRESWIDSFVRSGSESQDLQMIETILEKFDPINPKLLMLGHKQRQKDCLLEVLLDAYADENMGTWDPSSFLDFVSNIPRLKEYTADFYFGHPSYDDIFEKIGESDLSSSLKAVLYDFYLFPERYAFLIQKEMNKVFLTLEKFHTDHLEQIVTCQEAFNYELLDSKNIPFAKKKKWDKGLSTCFVSFSLIHKYVITRNKVDDSGWIILGFDYAKAFEQPNEIQIDIAGFGNAFGDKLRVKIFELIVQNGEMTLAALSKELGVVNTIAIYHIDVLKKENLLLNRHEGRKVLYCLNSKQIHAGLEAIAGVCGFREE